ncbi:MAG TPA: hypothetical protein VFN62_10415 [Acidobacteriaceae bacterium]|nr:hypothetical protein [Acidobacteriaceae bacterium]
MKNKLLIPVFALCFGIAISQPLWSQSQIVETPPMLDEGFHEMYNLHFSEAHAVFAKYMVEHPEDPMGPVSDAAAYLFSEFHRTGVLDMQLFTNDTNYLQHKTVPDPAIKKAFDADLNKADGLSDSILTSHPSDATALFAKTLTFGLRADYASLIERRDIAGFQFTKAGSAFAHRLLAVDPHAYDAYLAVGMENYILGLKPAPVRWLLQMAGGETNKALGEQDLELTAAQGHYLKPLAKLLLSVAAVRDNDTAKARKLLSSLAQEFPNNPLYAQQLAKLK